MGKIDRESERKTKREKEIGEKIYLCFHDYLYI